MTPDDLASVTLEHLRAIRAKQDQHDERLDRIEIHLSTIEQTLGGLYALSGRWRRFNDYFAIMLF